MYLRVDRNPVPNLTTEDEAFVPGKVYEMRAGTDLTIFAHGYMVAKSIEAAELLEKEGLSVRVVNCPSIKPINKDEVAQYAAEVNLVVEEHSIYGGLGDVIAATLSEVKPAKLVKYAIHDEFGCSAHDYEELLAHFGFTGEKIAEAARQLKA